MAEFELHPFGVTIHLSAHEAEALNHIVQEQYMENLNTYEDFYDERPQDLEEGGQNWYPGLYPDQRSSFVAFRQLEKSLTDEFHAALGPI